MRNAPEPPNQPFRATLPPPNTKTKRMARAREDTRLLDNPDGKGNAGCSFEPTLETGGDDGLAPPASSRLRLADELDTYLDRVQVCTYSYYYNIVAISWTKTFLLRNTGRADTFFFSSRRSCFSRQTLPFFSRSMSSLTAVCSLTEVWCGCVHTDILAV